MARPCRGLVPSYAYGHAYGYASGYAYGYAHGLVLATPTATPPATLAAAPTAALMATPAATPTATPTATLCGPRYDSEVRASEALEGIRAALALTVRAWGAVVSQGLAPVPALCLAVVSQCLAPVRAGGGGHEPGSGSRPRAPGGHEPGSGSRRVVPSWRAGQPVVSLCQAPELPWGPAAACTGYPVCLGNQRKKGAVVAHRRLGVRARRGRFVGMEHAVLGPTFGASAPPRAGRGGAHSTVGLSCFSRRLLAKFVWLGTRHCPANAGSGVVQYSRSLLVNTLFFP